MDENIVTNIINVLKTSNDKTVIYKALVKLRTDLVKDRDGIVLFRNCGGIPPVVRFLNRPHEKILEVSLSILGNCCTDEECCTQALNSKIIPPLLTILKSIPSPIVQCRACRLLGNIAKDNRDVLITSHSAAISQSLCLILEENNEAQTTMMAARAIKFLVGDKLFLLDFIKCEGFNIVMKILMKYMKNTQTETIDENEESSVPAAPVGRKSHQPREEYFKEVARHLEGVRSDIFDSEMLKVDKKKSTEFSMPTDKPTLDLISELLKCIQMTSEMTGYVPLIGLYPERYAFPCLVYCTDENNMFRSVVLRILANFARSPQSLVLLSSADTITAVCYLATASNLEKPLTEAESKHCLSIICLLSGDACNRAKIRRSGALKHLLEKANNSSITDISMILFALNNFQYDHLSMDLLLRGGLVGILIKELDNYMNSTDKVRHDRCDENKELAKKRKCSPDNSNLSRKNPKLWIESYEPDSPGSSNSQSVTNNLSPSSPSSSRSMSPVSFIARTFYDPEDDEDYSPVCSDVGDSDDDDAEIKVDENSDIMKMLVLSSKNETKIEDATPSDHEDEEQDLAKTANSSCMPTRTIDIMDNLLLRITLQLKNRSDLSKPQTLKTIIRAINVFGATQNSFSTSLNNIITDSAFFVIVIKQETIHSIYRMTRIDELKTCGESLLDTLTNVAESGYGRGELARLLTKGDALTQKRAASAVSFVVKTPRVLYQHLTEHGAIYILLNCILNKNDEIRFEAIDGITSLSQTLGIVLPAHDLEQFNCEKEFEEDTDVPPYTESEDLMKFVLHRGCSEIPIKFDKKLLTENSDVFNSMLNSDFKESKEKEIHLKDYSVHGIKYFLNLIKLESEHKNANIPPVYHFESILEAYELSRIYIIESLATKLFQLIISRLDAKSILKVFEWSLKNYNPELSEIAINYYLCSSISSNEKVGLFHEADHSTYSKEWNQMMVDAILVRCQNIGAEG